MTATVRHDLDIEEYHRLAALSNSGMSHILRSPAHYRAYRAEHKDSPALLAGRAIHTAVLEPELYGQTYFVAPACDRRYKEGKAVWADFLAGLPQGYATVNDKGNPCLSDLGKAAVLERSVHEMVQAVAHSVLQHPALKRAGILEGARETTIMWTCEETGADLRVRPDVILPSGVVLDLKSAVDASPAGFRRAAANRGYYRQDPFYQEGMRLAFGECPGFLFLAAEKEPPYAVAVYQLDDGFRAHGESEWRKAAKLWKTCTDTNSWPGYEAGVHTLSAPRWLVQQEN